MPVFYSLKIAAKYKTLRGTSLSKGHRCTPPGLHGTRTLPIKTSQMKVQVFYWKHFPVSLASPSLVLSEVYWGGLIAGVLSTLL